MQKYQVYFSVNLNFFSSETSQWVEAFTESEAWLKVQVQYINSGLDLILIRVQLLS